MLQFLLFDADLERVGKSFFQRFLYRSSDCTIDSGESNTIPVFAQLKRFSRLPKYTIKLHDRQIDHFYFGIMHQIFIW